MMPRQPSIALASLALLLAGCAGPAIPRATAPAVGVPAPITAPRATQTNSLIGQDGKDAIRLLGKPRLDLTEGSGRKLQFAGSACILDVYLYPERRGAEPVATHVDARTPDGRNANVPSCIDALRR